MPASKNAYFTYVNGHRDVQQVWNVNLIGFNEGISIWVQGGENAGFNRPTTFAKKHLLTFKGGKEESLSGRFRNKAAHILQKRSTPFDPTNAKRAQYGAQINPNNIQNSLIFCDKFPSDPSDCDSLPQLFGQAMYTPSKKGSTTEMGHAFIEVVSNQLYGAINRPDSHSGHHTEVTNLADPSRLFRVHFGFFQAGRTNFQVFHLEGIT